MQSSIMFAKYLVLAFALLWVTVSATPCPHSKNIITCCASARPTYSNGKVVKWSCLRCDDGYKVSGNKQQCIQDSKDQCGRGKGRDYFGNCAKCADKNCKTCSHLWTFCNSCKNGYTTDGDGQCVPLLLGR